MGNIFLLFAMFLTSRAEAGIFPIFNREGNQATLMISGIGRDPDAQHLFEALAVGQQDEQGKWTKKAAYTDPAGVKAFSVICVFSKIVEGNGSCTVVLHSAKGVTIDKENKSFAFEVSDPAEAAKMAAVFLAAPSGVIYRSANGLFEATAVRDAANQVVRFLLSYR